MHAENNIDKDDLSMYGHQHRACLKPSAVCPNEEYCINENAADGRRASRPTGRL